MSKERSRNSPGISILYLSRSDVEAVGVTMPEIIEALEVAFHEHGEGKVEMPPKPGVHSRPDAFIHAMPAYIPALHSVGVKWVSAYPENYRQGLPYISGLVILNDDETGLPRAVMDCTWITGMRTERRQRSLPGTWRARFCRRDSWVRRAGTDEPRSAQRSLSAQESNGLRPSAMRMPTVTRLRCGSGWGLRLGWLPSRGWQ
jgi:hypothetical protein